MNKRIPFEIYISRRHAQYIYARKIARDLYRATEDIKALHGRVFGGRDLNLADAAMRLVTLAHNFMGMLALRINADVLESSDTHCAREEKRGGAQ